MCSCGGEGADESPLLPPALTLADDLIEQLALKDEMIWQLAQSASEGGLASKHISTTYEPPAAAKPKPPRLGQRPKPSSVPAFALRAAGAMVQTPPRRVLRDQIRVSKPAWNDGHDGGNFNKKLTKAQAAMPNAANLKKQLNTSGTVNGGPGLLPKKQQQTQQTPLAASASKKKTSPKKGQGPPPRKLGGGNKSSSQPIQQQKAATTAAARAKVGHQQSAA